MQDKAAIEDDDCHARQCNQRTDYQWPACLDASYEGNAKYHSHQGSRADYETDVVDIGKPYSIVFSEKEDGASHDTQQQHNQLIMPCPGKKPAWRDETDIGD